MSWEADVEILRAFRTNLTGAWGMPEVARAAPGQRVAEAAWRTLVAAFVDGHRIEQGLVELSAIVLGAVGGYGRRALEELALARPGPGADFTLVPLLLTITGRDHDLFFDVLLDALHSGDTARVGRALTLVYTGYGNRFPFRITSPQADVLDATVFDLRVRGSDDATLRELLGTYVRPAVSRR